VGQLVGLERIDVAAAGDDVLPAGLAAALARDDVVEGQVRRTAALAGVLAGVVVADEHVLAVELDLGDRKAVEGAQQQHLGHQDLQPHGVDHQVVRMRTALLRIADPFRRVHRRELAVAGVDDTRVVLAQQAECAAHADDVDRLPVAVQHKHPEPRSVGTVILDLVAANAHG